MAHGFYPLNEQQAGALQNRRTHGLHDCAACCSEMTPSPFSAPSLFGKEFLLSGLPHVQPWAGLWKFSR